MKKSEWTSWSHEARDTRGSEIAEAAMVLPLFFMIFMAIFWFGEAFHIYGAMAHAARLGAEAAVAPACTTCAGGATAPANAQSAVYNALAASHLDKNKLVAWGGANPKWTPPGLCACGSASNSCTTSAVSCDSNVTDVCVQTNAQLSYVGQGGMGTCGISVSARYQYPYSFRIPFTALDLSNMLLPGQAQMRQETQ